MRALRCLSRLTNDDRRCLLNSLDCAPRHRIEEQDHEQDTNQLPQVLFVADLFHPLNDFAVERLLNRDVRHRRCRRGAVPMSLVRRAPDHVARTQLNFWLALALYPAKAGGDDQNLPERMCMPSRTRARLEGHTRAAHTRRIGSLEQRVNAHSAGKVLIWSFARM